MFSRIDTVGSDVNRGINLAVDCGVLLVASMLCSTATEQLTWYAAALYTAALAIAIWLLGSRLLRQPGFWRGRGRAAILVATSVLALVTTGVVAALRGIVPSYAAATEPDQFLLVLWPSALALR